MRVRLRVPALVRWGSTHGLDGGAGKGAQRPGREQTIVTSTAGGAFGFASGLIVQEFGYDDDVDEALRRAAEAETGTGLIVRARRSPGCRK